MGNETRQGGLLAWQWRVYPATHRDRLNLLIHMVAVPAFIAGTMATVVQVLHARWFGAAVALLLMVLAFAVQRAGHQREQVKSEPLAGFGDFIARVFAEQFITFPRFVLMGLWVRNFAEQENRG